MVRVRMINYWIAIGRIYGVFSIESSKVVGGSRIEHRAISAKTLITWEKRRKGALNAET